MRIHTIIALAFALLCLHCGLDLLPDMHAAMHGTALDWLIVLLDAAALSIGAGLLVYAGERIVAHAV